MKCAKFIVLGFLCSILTRTDAKNRSATCLPLFDQKPSVYAPCIDKACVLFKREPPIVELGSKPHPPEQEPFLCRARHALYPGLCGIMFDFITKIPELDDPFCINAGDCSYDDLVNFMEDAASNEKYRFIVGDPLFVLPYRISKYAEPSVPFFGGFIMIFGPRYLAIPNAVQEMQAVLMAFGRNTWIMVVCFFALLFVLRALLMVSFLGRQRTLVNWYWAMWGEYTQLPIDPTPLEKENRERLKFWAGWWYKVTAVTFAIVVLFYELGVVGFIFNGRIPQLDIPVQNFSRDLRQFSVVAGSAQAYLFRLLADPNQKYAGSDPPWNLVKDVDQVFINIRNRSHPTQFGITYEQKGKFLLREQDACDQFAVFRTRDPAQKYMAAWFYGIGIPTEQRVRINRRISTLESTRRVDKIIRGAVPDSDDPCGEQPKAVGAFALLPLLILASVPFVLTLTALLLVRLIKWWASFRRR